LPPELGRIILEILEKDRARRYQSASELLEELKKLKQEVDSGRNVTARPPVQTPEPRRKRAVAGLRWRFGAALIVLAMAAGTYVYLHYHPSQRLTEQAPSSSPILPIAQAIPLSTTR
jgi:hypothetical protein